MAEDKGLQSRIHRFQVDDVVSLQNDSHPDLDQNAEGTVTGFDNDEMTYLKVDFDGDEHVLTEDELRRVA